MLVRVILLRANRGKPNVATAGVDFSGIAARLGLRNDCGIRKQTFQGMVVSREDPVRILILRLSTLNYRSPQFSASLERKFVADASAFRRRRQWLECWVGVGIYLALATVSEILSPTGGHLQFELRLGLIVSLVVLVSIAMRLRYVSRRQEGIMLTASCLVSSLEVLFALAHWSGDEYSAQLAIVAVLVFTNTVVRLRLQFAVLAFSWGILAEYVLIVHGSENGSPPQNFHAAMVLAVCVLTLVANFSQDREARLAFLKRAQKDDLVGSLAESNQLLANAGRTDSLTGLPNRSSLNACIARIWSDPPLAKAECSVIIIDIDHFKRLNDRYGHLYGDRVIRRVARLLSEALRGEDDFIARYGGEEFIVLLPRTPATLALKVAERLRGVVELAGLPSLHTGEPDLEGLRATVSCGVACGVPQRNQDPAVLIHAADQALYRAKTDGRNLVRH